MKSRVSKQRTIFYLIVICIVIVLLLLVITPVRQFLFQILGKMTTANFAILFSFIAVCISTLNYIEKFRPAKIEATVHDSIIIVEGTDGRNSDLAHIPVTFSNVGYNSAVITKCNIVISSNTNERLRWCINWSSFCKTEGGTWINESVVFPIALNARTSISKVITFAEVEGLPFYLIAGEYTLEFSFWIDASNNCYSNSKFKLLVDQKIADEHLKTPPSSHTNVKLVRMK